MAASFNTTLERLKGDVIGRELRAIALAEQYDWNKGPGLSCFSPSMLAASIFSFCNFV